MNIYLEHFIDAGHRIVDHKGKCARLHGHTYRFEVELEGPVEYPGFVIDFGDIKELIHQWDHRMLLWDQDPIPFSFDEWGVVRLPFNPTAENMAEHICRGILRLSEDLVWCRVVVWETPKASAIAEFENEEV